MKHAIVRSPPSSFKRCISSHPLHNKLNITLARKQHKEYCRILSELGLDLIELPIDEEHPDSCFVEDTAIIFGEKAIITCMAKESRRGEDMQVEQVLRKYKHLSRIIVPGTIEGGDVAHLTDSLICGITERTNQEGVTQTTEFLKVRIEVIEDNSIVHLKSYLTFIDDENVVVSKRFAEHPVLHRYRQLIVPEDEEYAANTLTINGNVLMSSWHPKSIQMVKDAGFDVVTIDMSEFEKCEGAITCLSLVF
ncbi:MAG: arginine deiminase family protein [Candidatus Thorarchaeota archaeon]|nr:arginine deiminase family protein [Candidatus Thorarchaeota archaeon]